jgi:hypothetical protein
MQVAFKSAYKQKLFTLAGVGWATFVSTFGFTITLILLMLYLFHVVDMMPAVPWIVGVSSAKQGTIMAYKI